MLGNNKRRLYHFGVKHLQVLPLINQELRKRKATEVNTLPKEDPNSLVDEIVEEDDDFEITYDDQPKSSTEKNSDEKRRTILLKTPKELQSILEISPEKLPII